MDSKAHLFWFMGKPALITPSLFLSVFISCFGSSLLFGYSMAVLNNLELNVKCFLTKLPCADFDKSSNRATTLYASLTAAYIVLGSVGSFSSGIISDTFGRKKSLIFNNIIGIVGGALSLSVLATGSVINIFVARLVLGLNAGITTGIAPTFIAEISPTPLRGALTACHQLSVTLGITLAYIMTLTKVLNRTSVWIIALGVPIVPAIISLIILPFCPESPRYLFINLNDAEKAKSAFAKYNQIQDAGAQLKEIKEEVDSQSKLPKFKIIDLFLSKSYRLAIIISIVLNVMQQFSGINAVMAYSQSMFRDSNIHSDSIEYCVLGIGILNSAATIPAVMLMEVFGRRTLFIYASILAVISLIGCFLMIGIFPNLSTKHTAIFAIVSVVFICLFIVGFAIGMGPVPGIIVAEMFTQGPRAAAYSLALGIQWASSFIILMLYPVINNLIKTGFVFVIFFVITILCLIFLCIFMPETKNRSFADIAKELSGNKVANDPTSKA